MSIGYAASSSMTRVESARGFQKCVPCMNLEGHPAKVSTPSNARPLMVLVRLGRNTCICRGPVVEQFAASLTGQRLLWSSWRLELNLWSFVPTIFGRSLAHHTCKAHWHRANRALPQMRGSLSESGVCTAPCPTCRARGVGPIRPWRSAFQILNIHHACSK